MNQFLVTSAEEHTLRAQQEYGNQTIGRYQIFGDAGFINFGFWKNIAPVGHFEGLTMKDRNESAKELYRYLWKQINLLSTSAAKQSITILEVGCSTGSGLSMLMEDLDNDSQHMILVGQDITPQQLQRAKDRLSAVHSSVPVHLVSNLVELESNSFDIIFSVETLQAVENLDSFVQHAARLPNSDKGALAFAMHLCPHSDRGMKDCEKSYQHGHRPISWALYRYFSKFVDIKVQSIGEYVFPAWGAFSDTLDVEESFVEAIVQAWREGVLDYYIVTAYNHQSI
jgi:2-polyprenyl-3-methyl-5-hydroxy-6-metoxy-1,4-benzoquinol methylase